jgi:hypothetical protein
VESFIQGETPSTVHKEHALLIKHPSHSTPNRLEFCTMCTADYYKSMSCEGKCRWLEIGVPCGYGMGFNNCDAFEGRHTRQLPRRFHKVGKDQCPKHGLGGNYDHNRVAMIRDIKYCPCM